MSGPTAFWVPPMRAGRLGEALIERVAGHDRAGAGLRLVVELQRGQVEAGHVEHRDVHLGVVEDDLRVVGHAVGGGHRRPLVTPATTCALVSMCCGA